MWMLKGVGGERLTSSTAHDEPGGQEASRTPGEHARTAEGEVVNGVGW